MSSLALKSLTSEIVSETGLTSFKDSDSKDTVSEDEEDCEDEFCRK